MSGELVSGEGYEGAAESATNTLYLIDQNNTARAITVTEEKAHRIKPLAVFDTKKYVLINYDRHNWPRPVYRDQICSIVLLRKTDSAMFCADVDINCNQWSRCNEDMVQADASGDIIYVRGDSLQKLDLRSAGNPTVLTLIKNGVDGRPAGLAVNEAGDALVTFDNADFTNRYVRAYAVDGGFTPLATGWGKDCVFSGIGANTGKLYYIDTGANRIYQLVKTNGVFVRTTYYDYSWFNPGGIELGPISCWGTGLFARTNDRIFLRSTNDNKLVEMVNPENMPKRYTIGGVASIDRMRGYADKLVLQAQDDSGRGMILRYDVVTRDVETVVPADEYVISASGVSADGDISFSGQRTADGARIMAEVRAGSTLVNVVNTGFGDATQILRIILDR